MRKLVFYDLRACRRFIELSTALAPLFQKYYEPISKEVVVSDENGKRRLLAYIEPHIALTLNQIFNVTTSKPLKPNGDKVRRKIMTERQGFDETLQYLDFHLSVSGKYLLISAFIALRNPVTHEKQ
jgi:origin recognition complex subunit 5